jgi:hypothetical protein
MEEEEFTGPVRDEWGFINLQARLFAQCLDGMEAERIAMSNRLGQMTRSGLDKDGKNRGFNMPKDHPQVIQMQEVVDLAAEAEAKLTKMVEAEFRKHPLYRFVKKQKGWGDKQVARLLANLGDPYWNHREDRRRLVSELWAYCGYGGDGEGRPQKRRRGQKSNWSSRAKSKAFLVAESCMKQRCKPCGELQETMLYGHVEGCTCSPYRLVYEAERMRYEGAVHRDPCAQCGLKGKPAPAGSPLSQSHLRGRALRHVAKKAVLPLLYDAAKAVHEGRQP